MDSKEFYSYISHSFASDHDSFGLDSASLALVRNILDYIDIQEFVDDEDARRHLNCLLDGAIGLEEWEIKMYRSHADYPLMLKSLSTAEMEYAVGLISGHEESEEVRRQSDPFEIEMSCGCIEMSFGNRKHSCWAGLLLDGGPMSAVREAGAWSTENFIAHVKEAVAKNAEENAGGGLKYGT